MSSQQTPISKLNASSWMVYVLLCSDGSLYTGITNNIENRFKQHACGKGAKFFRGRRPVRLVYLETDHTRSSAARREIAIKKLSRNDKLGLIATFKNPEAKNNSI